MDQACVYGKEVVTITLNSSSQMLRNGVFRLRAQLEPHANASSVVDLDKHLERLN